MGADGDPLRASLADRIPGLRELVERGQAAEAAADQAIAETPPQREQQETMAKEENEEATKSPRDFTEVEQRAVLEATRGLGDKALREWDKADKLRGVSRTTIYTWRKKHWGTMNAHGIATERPRPKLEQEPEEEAVSETKVAKDGRVYRPDEERRRHVLAAREHPLGKVGYEREHGLPRSSIFRWEESLGMTDGRLGAAESNRRRAQARTQGLAPPRKGPGGATGRNRSSQYTIEQQQHMARAAVASGNAAKWARESGVKPSTLAGWVKKYGPADAPARRPGRKPKAPAPRALVHVSDAELISNYEQARAVAKASREPMQRLLEENKRLRKLIVVLKANLAYAIEEGLVKHLTLDLMFTEGGKDNG